MTYNTNLPAVINTVNLKLSKIQRDEMCRLQAFSLMAVMKERIHIQGKDSNGAQIGTYTPAYVKRRMRKYKRDGDPRVIISLTRQLENGWQPIQITNGWALALATQEDLQKARWCEETYKKPIFAPTEEEKALCKQIADDYIAEQLKS